MFVQYVLHATNLVTGDVTWFSIKSAVLPCCVILANYATIPPALISFISAALRQAVLQGSTYPFQNALVKMRNQLIKAWNGLGTNRVLLQKRILTETVWFMYFEQVGMNSLYIFIYFDAFLLIFYLLWKSFDLLCILVFIVSVRE